MSFLRKIFEPSEEHPWKQLADEIGGEFIRGGFMKDTDKVVKRVKQWTITLQTYRASFQYNPEDFLTPKVTRIVAPYVDKDDFRFRIYRQDIASN